MHDDGRKLLIAGGGSKCKRILSRSMKHARSIFRYQHYIAIIASSKGYRGWHNGIPRYINFVCTFFRHPSISMVLPFSWLFSFKPDVCKPSLTLICLRSSSLWPIPSPPLLPCVAPSFSLESTRHDRRVPLFYLYEWPVRFLFRGENEIPSITVWIQSIVL